VVTAAGILAFAGPRAARRGGTAAPKGDALVDLVTSILGILLLLLTGIVVVLALAAACLWELRLILRWSAELNRVPGCRAICDRMGRP
jgi:hypothetical protein